MGFINWRRNEKAYFESIGAKVPSPPEPAVPAHLYTLPRPKNKIVDTSECISDNDANLIFQNDN